MKAFKSIPIALIAALILASCACGKNDSNQPTPDALTNENGGAQVNQTDGPMAPAPHGGEVTTMPPKQAINRDDDAAFIDEAWPVADRLGSIYGIKLDKNTADVKKEDKTATVVFKAENSKDVEKGVQVGYLLNNENNKFMYSMNYSRILFDRSLDDEFGIEIESWKARSDTFKIVITPEDVAQTGCTETEGEAYMEAVGNVYANKLIALYTKDAPQGFPGRCVDAGIAEVFYDESTDEFDITLGVVPQDLLSFETLTEGDSTLLENTDNPALWGYMEYSGLVKLAKENGNWVGTAIFGM